jgi:hypothetical protein
MITVMGMVLQKTKKLLWVAPLSENLRFIKTISDWPKFLTIIIILVLTW